MLVVPALPAPAQPHPAGGPVECGDGAAGTQLDVVFRVPRRVVDVDGVAFGGAEQEALGQRWSLVGAFRIAAEQDDSPGESFGAECLSCLRAGESGSDDDESAVV